MWRYYLLLTELTSAAVEEEKRRGRPFESKLALARRIVADFHAAEAGDRAEAEWRRVHQEGNVPADIPVQRIRAGRYKPHELLAGHDLAASKSEAVRLLRQKAVRRDGQPLEAGAEIEARPGESFVVSVGPSRFVRFEVGGEEG
jgi:tyrosyl-tRNA synthetase